MAWKRCVLGRPPLVVFGGTRQAHAWPGIFLAYFTARFFFCQRKTMVTNYILAIVSGRFHGCCTLALHFPG
eukprot:4938402-Prorocentrum_lima.AAC.1